MKSITKPDAFFFDWDDTIFFNTFYAQEALRKLVKRHITKLNSHMFPTNPEISLVQNVHMKFAKMTGLTLDKIISRIFVGDTPYFSDQFRKQYNFAKQKHGMKFLEGGIRTLQTIYKMGIPMFIISNKRGQLIRSEVKTAKVDHMFSAILGDGDCTESKPSPTQIFEAAKMFEREHGKKINLSNSFMVGDAVTDIQAALAAGCEPIHIGHTDYLPPEFRRDCESGKILSFATHKEFQVFLNTMAQKGNSSSSKKNISLAPRSSSSAGAAKAPLKLKKAANNK